jgi:2-aminoethylphosphonate-pyruvate transaminase
MSKLTLGQILLQKGFVKPDDLKQARNIQIQNPSKSLAEILISLNVTSEVNILTALAERMNVQLLEGAIFVTDTTSTLGMIPLDVVKDNVDFCMASAQKGLMAMSGLSFIIGRKDIIEKSKEYPTRSYYCNLYLQYSFFEKTGEMHFTPPVQTIYATIQALKEYFAEGETAKFARHRRVYEAIRKGVAELGFDTVIDPAIESGLVVSVKYPEDPNWDFEKVHDFCYDRGFTIYPGKISTTNTFRLCALGAIDVKDIEDFFKVLGEALQRFRINL